MEMASVPAVVTGGGEAALVAREQSEIQAMVVLAYKNPRSEDRALEKAIKSFSRIAMASEAEYKFPRGKDDDGNQLYIEGPSVYLAREVGRCWSNIDFGFRIVSVDDEYVHLRGFALDLETNTRSNLEAKFRKQIQRKRSGGTVWIDADETQLRELTNKHGAILERNCLLKVVPPWFVEEALQAARAAIKKDAAAKLKKDRKATLEALVKGFAQLGVIVEWIAEQLGHPVDDMTDEEYVTLRGVYKAIKDGQTTKEAAFGKQPPAAVKSETSDAANELAGDDEEQSK